VADAFRKLFPVGTPKEFVDHVLVESGKATSKQTTDVPGLWHYLEPRHFGYPAGPMHNFIFDEHGKVLNVKVSASEYLYSDQITVEDIRNNARK
jgi:hypothetical protein